MEITPQQTQESSDRRPLNIGIIFLTLIHITGATAITIQEILSDKATVTAKSFPNEPEDTLEKAIKILQEQIDPSALHIIAKQNPKEKSAKEIEAQKRKRLKTIFTAINGIKAQIGDIQFRERQNSRPHIQQ